MANTVSNISYANTFGEWVVATNGLINENNTLAVGDYTKSTGTIYLNETTKTGLQANGNLVVQGSFTSQGIGSSARIQNNLTVDGQIYFSNTTLGLTNSGQANINGLLIAQGPNTSLSVANNTYMGGNTTIRYNTITNNLQANTSVNTTTFSATGGTYTDTLQANTSILTGSIQANSYVNTAVVSASATVYGNYVQANTSVITPTALVSGTTFSDILRANSYVTTPTAAVSGTTFSDIVQANTSILTGNLQANNYVNSTILSASSIVYGNRLQANTSSNTSDAYVVNTTWTNYLQANTTVFANTSVTTNSVYSNVITANTTVTSPNMVVTTKLDGNTAAAFLNSLQVQGGGLTVNGNFILTGTTVYASNTFQLSTGATSGISSYIQVARGSSGTNAAIRWNEPSKYWDMLNVNSNTYYRVLTNEYITSLTTDTSTTNVASAAAANTLNIFTASAYATSNAAFLQANTAFTQDNAAFLQANNAYATANAAKTTFVGSSASFQANTIIFSSNNGVNFGYVGANTMTINTPQDLRTFAGVTFGTLALANSALDITQGGTGARSKPDALTALLPTGTTSGYVLTTGGPGSFYWAAGGGGGGGATPGTTINSTRLSYTANGAAGYTGNTFVVPPSLTSTQVRAYINGVRQFESEYNLTQSASSNTISFLTTPPNNDNILIEVDGYIINPYYANNIPFTINSEISASANTIQLAVDGLTSKLTSYYANTDLTTTFSGPVLGVTMPNGTSNTTFATTAFVQAFNTFTSGVTTGSYGGGVTASSFQLPTITVNAQGKVTQAANVTVTNTSVYANTGQLTANASVGVVALGLPTTGVIAGNYGSGTTTPVLTVDAYGRITGASTTLITGGSAGIGATTYTRTSYTATAGQTSFSATYTVGYVQVYHNGILLAASDYTASSGTAIVLGVGANLNDIIDIFAYTVTLVNNISPSYAGGQGGAAGVVLYQSAANTTSNTSVGTSGYLLTSAGTGQPTWTNPATLTVSAASTATSATSAGTFTSTSQNSQFNSIGVNTAASAVAGEIRATSTITAGYSDDQLKTKLGNIDNALDKLMTLNGFYYEPSQLALDLGYTSSKQVGVSAQEVQKVLPEVVVPAPIDDKYLTVHYDRLIPLLVEAIKELKNEVEVLKGQIK